MLRRARKVVGPDYIVGCRMLAEECIERGSGAEDAATFAQAGMDYIPLSRGGRLDDAAQPVIGTSTDHYTGPLGRNLEARAWVQRPSTTPASAADRIHGFS